jgi:hypothetical protein
MASRTANALLEEKSTMPKSGRATVIGSVPSTRGSPMSRSREMSANANVSAATVTGRYSTTGNCGTSVSNSITTVTIAAITNAPIAVPASRDERPPGRVAARHRPAANAAMPATATICGELQVTVSRPNS